MARRLAFPSIAAALLVMTMAALPARATTLVCEVLQTSDGFAALRAAPSADARLIARMKTGHNVQMRPDNRGEVIRSGSWTQVLYWPDGELYLPSQPEYRTARTGWVASRLIGDCG